jgi:hypothetical protein
MLSCPSLARPRVGKEMYVVAEAVDDVRVEGAVRLEERHDYRGRIDRFHTVRRDAQHDGASGGLGHRDRASRVCLTTPTRPAACERAPLPRRGHETRGRLARFLLSAVRKVEIQRRVTDAFKEFVATRLRDDWATGRWTAGLVFRPKVNDSCPCALRRVGSSSLRHRRSFFRLRLPRSGWSRRDRTGTDHVPE